MAAPPPDHFLGRRPVPTAVLGASVIAFSAILVRLADVSPETATLFRCGFALPFLGAIAWWERKRFGPRPLRERAWSLAAGVLFSADLIFWHHAIANVGAGLATVLGNLQVVLVAFLAWVLLSEPPGRRVTTAVPVVFLGAVLISGALEQGAYGDNPVMGTVFGLLTSLAYAGFILVLRRMNADIRRPAGPLFDATLMATIATLLIGPLAGSLDLTPPWPSVGWLLLLAVSSQVIGWLLISISLPRLPAALTSIVLLVQPVSSVALAAIILGEDPSAIQIAGVVVILAGVVWATSSRDAPETVAPASAPLAASQSAEARARP
jgi:drug/metabolite transporter (DMT)-like permease